MTNPKNSLTHKRLRSQIDSLSIQLSYSLSKVRLECFGCYDYHSLLQMFRCYECGIYYCKPCFRKHFID